MTTRPFFVPSFYVIELTALSAEVTFSRYRHWDCPTCGVYSGNRYGHTAVLFSRKGEIADIVRTAFGLLGRASVFECLLSNEILGWRQGRVDVVAKSRAVGMTLDYSEIIVMGRAHNYAQKTNLPVKFECPTCQRRQFRRPQHGVAMPTECWDKSDLFWIEEISLILATEQTKAAIESNGLTGVQFTPIDEWHDPLYMIR